MIVAAATPPGAAPRAVLRLSGAGLLGELARFLPQLDPPPPRRRGAWRARLPWQPGAWLNADLLVFPGPRSLTGEDVLELHLPGSMPVVAAVLADLHLRGARLAEPGEFTRRAFCNGRLDLVQAEAVLDLVEARTAAGAQAAAALLAGGFGAILQEARDALADALALLEAGLDFEEGDAQDVTPGEIAPLLARAQRALAAGQRLEERRRPHLGAWRILLRGAPNAGKTTLFGRLTGAAGLVSAEAGTTRDRREAPWRPPGLDEDWILADGPGLGGTAADPRDAAGRRRALSDRADLCWLLLDAAAAGDVLPPLPEEAPCLVVWTKCDAPRRASAELVRRAAALGPMVWVSSRSGQGFPELAAASAALLQRSAEVREARAGASERQQAALDQARAALERALRLRGGGAAAELVAEELRAALAPLGALVGELTPEDLLDRIFARFCIGK